MNQLIYFIWKYMEMEMMSGWGCVDRTCINFPVMMVLTPDRMYVAVGCYLYPLHLLKCGCRYI